MPESAQTACLLLARRERGLPLERVVESGRDAVALEAAEVRPLEDLPELLVGAARGGEVGDGLRVDHHLAQGPDGDEVYLWDFGST